MSQTWNGTKKEPPERRTYTVEDIAHILGIGRTSAYLLVKEGHFKIVRIGNAIRISKRSFDEWLESLDLWQMKGSNAMASIIKRKKNYSIVYNYTDENGETRQKWETRTSYQDALKRKAEVENQQFTRTFLPPTDQTIAEFLLDFVSLYGEKRWGVSMYDSQNSLISNYINPIIGDFEGPGGHTASRGQVYPDFAENSRCFHEDA